MSSAGGCSLQAKGDLEPANYNYLEGPSFITYENKSDHASTLSSASPIPYNDKLHERACSEGAGKACPTKPKKCIKQQKATFIILSVRPVNDRITHTHTQRTIKIYEHK